MNHPIDALSLLLMAARYKGTDMIVDDPCCMGWMYKTKCTCGSQARIAGRRTQNGVTLFAFDMPNWSRETTRVLDGEAVEYHDPAEALLSASRARIELMQIQQDEALRAEEDHLQIHEIPLEARMGMLLIRHLVEPYNLVSELAPAGAEERIEKLLRANTLEELGMIHSAQVRSDNLHLGYGRRTLR